MNYDFQIDGRINVETSDEAVDVIQLILEDNGIVVNKIVIMGKGGVLTTCKKK